MRADIGFHGDKNLPTRGCTFAASASTPVQAASEAAGSLARARPWKNRMLSPALSELLERARTRFGLEVEVMDATLKHVYPDGTTRAGADDRRVV